MRPDPTAPELQSGGIRVSPKEAQAVLSGHPAVLDVRVVGVASDDLGMELKALVRLVDSTAAGPLLALELLDYCAARLSRIKCPRSLDFCAEFADP